MKNDVLEVNEISFRRVKNTGDYSSVAFEAKAMVIADDADVAADTLRDYVDSVIERTMNEKKASKKVAKKPASKKKAKKVATKATEPNEDISNTDGNDSESTAISLTLENVQDKLKELWRAKGRNIAESVLGKFEVEKSAQLKEEDYPAVMKEIEKCLK